MTRPLEAATKEGLDKPVLPLAAIVYLDIEGDPLLAWSGIGDLPFSGGTRTNLLPNSSFSNPAANGTPALTTISLGSDYGVTRQIVGSGVEDGKPYIDLSISGTNNSGVIRYVGIMFHDEMSVEAGEKYAASAYTKLISGAYPANIGSLYFAERTPPSSYTYPAVALAPNANLERRQVIRTIANGAEFTRMFIQFNIQPNVAYNFVIRIAAPQLELVDPNASFAYPSAFISTNSGPGSVTDVGETGDPSLDGKTFKGTGTIIEISAISEGVGGSDALEIALPGVDIYEPMLRQLITNRNRWQFRRAVVWLMLLDPDTDAIAGKPFRIKTGRMDRMPLSESKGNGVVKCVIEGHQTYGNTALGTRYSEQRDINPNDVSQKHVHALANMTAALGQASHIPGTGGGNNGGGGGGGSDGRTGYGGSRGFVGSHLERVN